MQHHKRQERDQDDKRRRVDEPVSPVSTVAQGGVLTLSPVHLDSETRNDEIAVDVALPEEPTEMSGESGQGWITEEALFTVSPDGQQVRQRKEVKMNRLSPAEKREFLKSMEVEWQTLFKNQADRVLSLEETVQARARWPDRAVDTRWARTWKPDESKPSGRRAKARLIIKGFTDPDLLDSESHSPTLTLGGLCDSPTVCVQSGTQAAVWGCTAGFSTLETRSSEKEPLFVRMPPDGIPGESREVWVQLLKTVNGLADGYKGMEEMFPRDSQKISVLRHPSWNRVFWSLRGSQQKYHDIVGCGR